MMCHTVFSYKPGSIKTKNYVKILNCNIMYYFIKSTLHKSRIDVTKRNQTFFSQTSGKSNCMFFSYTHIKSAVRKF